MTLSARSTAQLQALDDFEGFLLLLRIDSPSFSAPVRVVRDTRNWTIGCETYSALPIQITLPQDVQGEQPSAKIELDNVGRDVLGELEVLPAGTILYVTLRVVSRGTPEVIDWEFTAAMTSASANYTTISIDMGDGAIFDAPAVQLRYDPDTAPGLF